MGGGAGGAARCHQPTSISDKARSRIFRYDRNRRATIEADLVGGAALGDALTQIRALPVMKGLPPGVGVDEAGDAETMQELFGEFGGAMRNGLMMVFAVLVLLFGSFLQPMTILFSLPLSIGGVIGALLLVSQADQHAGDHRHTDADGHRDQERRSCWSTSRSRRCTPAWIARRPSSKLGRSARVRSS